MDRPPTHDDWTRARIAALRDGAMRNDAESLTILGILSREGVRHSNGDVVVKRDPAAARRYLERAVALGDPDAMCSLADELSASHRSSWIARAQVLYRRAFRNGVVSAAFNLACMYQNLGRFTDAVKWFRRAYDAGDASALLQLARAELYGIGTKRDPNSAFAKLRKVAHARSTAYWPSGTGEDLEAMVVMADAMLNGWLVARDYAAGVRLLRLASKRNSEVAQAMLALNTTDIYRRIK